MPMYEFDCDACGERFEDLVAAGTEQTACRRCGSEDTRRVLSVPGAPWKLVKTPGAAKRQESKNAKLHASTKARFKESRQRAREAKKGGGAKPGRP
jgi:putative FmdB family regulatory protein